MKRCSKCRKEKAVTEFNKDRQKKDGLSYQCSVCSRLRHKFYFHNPKNKARINEKYKRWRREHPEEYKLRNIAKSRKQRARTFGQKDNFTPYEWELLQRATDFTCVRCLITDVKLSPDHILPFCKGGWDTIDNIQPLCLPCQFWKSRKVINYLPLYFLLSHQNPHQSGFQPKEKQPAKSSQVVETGGEGGIRTLDRGFAPITV